MAKLLDQVREAILVRHDSHPPAGGRIGGTWPKHGGRTPATRSDREQDATSHRDHPPTIGLIAGKSA
jgi:hypothetical protein